MVAGERLRWVGEGVCWRGEEGGSMGERAMGMEGKEEPSPQSSWTKAGSREMRCSSAM